MNEYKGKREQAPQGPSVWEKIKAFYKGHEVICTVAGGILLLILALVIGVSLWWSANVKAPDLPMFGNDTTQTGENTTVPEGEEGLGSLVEGIDVNEELPDYIKDQKAGVYTFVVVGRTVMDDNADMIMLVVFDSNTGEIDACSIPRDTFININTSVRKINATIWGGIDYLKSWVRKTVGVYPNFYVMVDWQGVGDMVEAVGGVTFDVPCKMYYKDTTPGREFTIDLEPGLQKLNGDQAMQLIRWRKNAPGYTQYAYEAGFDGSDLKRTQMQQQFIVEAAKQILTVKNLPYLGSMIQVFTDNVETDLSIGNLAWFAQKALEKNSANQVEFHTLPAVASSCYCANVGNYQSYVTYPAGQLVELVNEHLNPYGSAITAGNLDLMSINADGTISSSTGRLADTEHNRLIGDINAGLAYFDSGYNVVYYENKETDEGTGTSDGTETNPDGTPSTLPEGGVVNPDGSVTYPDGTVVNPDGSITYPGGVVVYPDGTDPDTPVTNPDGTTDPGSTVTNPDDTATNPDGTGQTEPGSSGEQTAPSEGGTEQPDPQPPAETPVETPAESTTETPAE